MNPIYEMLYEAYLEEISHHSVGYNESSMEELLDPLPLGKAARLDMLNKFFDYYLLWTEDAFAAGLQTGLRLLAGPKVTK